MEAAVKLCGAKWGNGTCQRPAEVNPRTGNGERCAIHGAKATGPRTEAGRAAVASAARRKWDQIRAWQAAAEAAS